MRRETTHSLWHRTPFRLVVLVVLCYAELCLLKLLLEKISSAASPGGKPDRRSLLCSLPATALFSTEMCPSTTDTPKLGFQQCSQSVLFVTASQVQAQYQVHSRHSRHTWVWMDVLCWVLVAQWSRRCSEHGRYLAARGVGMGCSLIPQGSRFAQRQGTEGAGEGPENQASSPTSLPPSSTAEGWISSPVINLGVYSLLTCLKGAKEHSLPTLMGVGELYDKNKVLHRCWAFL